MLGSKLYDFLEDLPTNEKSTFVKFTESSFFFSQTEQRILATILDYNNSNYKVISENPAALFKAVFPDTPYDEKKIKDHFYDIGKQLDSYAILKFLKKEPFQQQKITALIHHEKVDFKKFEKTIKAAEKSLDKKPIIYADYERLALRNYAHYFPFEDKKKFDKTELISVNNLLNKAFVLNKLRYYCEFLSQENIYYEIENLLFIKEIKAIAHQFEETNPLIHLYLELLKLLVDPHKTQFIKVKTLFETIISSIDPFDAIIIFILLTNYTIIRFSEKNETYLTYQFELYQLGLTHNLFSNFRPFSYPDFINVVTTGIAAKEITYVKDFIDKKSSLLPIDAREDTIKLAMAYYEFSIGEYSLAVKKAITLQNNNPIFALRASFLVLRCNLEFYLLDTADYRTSFLSTFNKIRRHIERLKKPLALKKQGYRNHLDIVKSIFDYMESKTKIQKELEKIEQKIQRTEILIGWQYLNEKIADLKKTYRGKL